MTRALALIDGEHYPSVVADALAELPYDVVAAVLVGGTEKLRGDADYGVPLADDLESAVERYEPELVLDLSDEPVLGPRERFRYASRSLALGLPYLGADFRFDPPELEPFDLPSLGIIGTGKRVGKTAVGGYIARTLSDGLDVVVVAMGRGGPAEPEVADVQPTLESLLELSRSGRHAASDYLEDAALAGVVTVGCRRAGGGFAGAPVASNVVAGAKLAAARDPELVIFEGSGAAIPPIETRKRILVIGAHQEPGLATGYLNAYRILISDLVILTMCEDGARHEEIRDEIREVKEEVPVIATIMRPRPVEPVDGKRVALFSTAPASVLERLSQHLRDEHGADVVHASCHLANREKLKEELESVDAEVYLVELKAAAIDVVAEAASERGIDVVFLDNEVSAIDGELDLDEELHALAEAARKEPAPA